MSWSGRGRDGRRGYHHGNLREALIQAALDLIAQKGPAGFTFADAARSAGVSSAAPYRHFRDRDALLADIARRGFELFAEHLAGAWNDGRPDPFAAFEKVGRAYLAFAREEPAYYSAMFEAGLSSDDDPALRQAQERSFAVLRRAAEVLCARLPPERRPPALMVSLHVARHRLAVRPRRRRRAARADAARRAARSRRAALSAGPRGHRRSGRREGGRKGRLTAAGSRPM
jgi:AcrR family transcriptional regulator